MSSFDNLTPHRFKYTTGTQVERVVLDDYDIKYLAHVRFEDVLLHRVCFRLSSLLATVPKKYFRNVKR